LRQAHAVSKRGSASVDLRPSLMKYAGLLVGHPIVGRV